WQRFTMDVERLLQGTRQVEARGRIRVTARGAMADLNRDDKVVVLGHLRAVRSFCNPGGFNYERYMALQGLHARLNTEARHIRREAAPPGWPARLDRFRLGLGQQMETALERYPPVTAQLLKALTLGDRDALPADLRERFQRAGVSHVLAISGLHIGMVAAVVFALVFRLLAWIPPLCQNGWVRRYAALLTLGPVIGYGLLAGLSPSTQRALLMVTVFLATFWVGRPHNWLNVLAVAALLILLASPPALTRISFQLSFAAVLAILLGMSVLPIPPPAPTHRWWQRAALRGAALMGVSVLAILGTAPLVMRHFNQITWVGPLTNLAVVPLVGLVVVPAGLLGVLCAPVSLTLGALFWHVAGLGLLVGMWIIERVARWPWVATTMVTPSVLEMVLFYLLLAVVLHWKKRTVRVAGLAVVIVVGGMDALYWYQRRFGGQRISVTAVDVGQGSANLLRLPGGMTVLVDGGGFSDNAYFDVGRQILAPLLLHEKIKTVDLVILTHPDSDHLNGLLHIVRHFRVREIWSNHEPADTLGYRHWRQAIETRGIVHTPFAQLERHTVRNGVRFDILGPPVDFRQRAERETWRDRNGNSLVVRMGWKEIAFLFTGDITAPAEAELVALHGPEALRTNILFVPHHGSNTSSSAPFLEAVQAAEGVMALGWQNRFGFPHDAVVNRLAAAGSRIWRTDLCGAVRIDTDGKEYRIRSCRNKCP
ncbi:MAG: DNA internalization-related competence protein ComEC/Rec2, partial [Desulfatitalea sp.]|nr:DNA internalization-related competence protein ComEC/Rec2 [Desulfatitalea sp.]